MFGNVMDRVTDANSTLDHTENLLQQLMGDNYLPDMDFTDTDTTGTSVSQGTALVRDMVNESNNVLFFNMIPDFSKFQKLTNFTVTNQSCHDSPIFCVFLHWHMGGNVLGK